MPPIVHPHFHPRRTGVTRHVETLVPALEGASVLTFGTQLHPALPRIGWKALWAILRRQTVIWHAHRNLELVVGLVLRFFAPHLRVAFTRHSGSKAGRYTRFLARRADLRIALTEEVRQAFGLPAEVISHGIDLQHFSPPPDRRVAWSELNQGGVHGVGVVGRIRPDKGQGDFVRAVAPLLSDFPDWVPILVGGARPAESGFLADMAREAMGRLRMPGEKPDPARWFRGLSICVQPSHAEAYSMALLEALACGCCVIASRLPNMVQVIEEGRTGFLYTPGDVADLRRLLSRLMAAPEEVERVGRNAVQVARDRFGVEHEASQLAAAYQKL